MQWINAPIEGEYTYVFLDGIWLKRCWAGEVKNVSVLVAFGVDQDGYRHVLGVQEGAKEDKESWTRFLRHLKSRGLKGIKLFVSDKCLGLVESLADFYPQAKWQRCVVPQSVWLTDNRIVGLLNQKVRKILDTTMETIGRFYNRH